MKIAVVSNYLNHHQEELCEALYRLSQGQFRFVADTPIPEDRLQLGYCDMNQYPYVIRAYESDEQLEEAEQWCLTSDVIIHGDAPDMYITKRMERGLPTFKYSERILKDGLIHALSPRARRNVFRGHTRYSRGPLYLLCASAYTAMDFRRFGAYKDKAYRWGYFPKVKMYPDVDDVLHSKRKHSLLWVSRFIDLKHPEAAIAVAERLKKEGYDITLSMIGVGPRMERCEKMIRSKGLTDTVHILGAMSPEEVRAHMEQSEIFLFTSDRQEGWGAVLNEAMNSACAVVASHAIGAVPYLLRDGENGFIYRDGSVRDLYEKVKQLLDDSSQRERMGRAAYDTLCHQWNAEEAAKRFIQLAEAICAGEESPDLFAEDVCSKAPLLKDGWYKG